jgi:hypothetical protein
LAVLGVDGGVEVLLPPLEDPQPVREIRDVKINNETIVPWNRITANP